MNKPIRRKKGKQLFSVSVSVSRMRDKRFPRESANGTWPWKEKRIFYISRPRGQRKRIVSRRRLFHRVNYPTQDESDWMESLHFYIRIFLKALYAPNICPPFFPSLPDNKLMTSNICLVSRGLLFFRGWMTNSSAYRHTRKGNERWRKRVKKKIKNRHDILQASLDGLLDFCDTPSNGTGKLHPKRPEKLSLFYTHMEGE